MPVPALSLRSNQAAISERLRRNSILTRTPARVLLPKFRIFWLPQEQSSFLEIFTDLDGFDPKKKNSSPFIM
jgi:hypothetical protein